MSWDQGYVSEIDYTYGYYSEFNPLQIQLNLISAGIKPPKIKTACELGFGQGVSLLCNAASSDIAWYGNDFNPNQVSFVNEAIQSTGLELNVTDESFEDFCARTDLPNFDFIALHGIWSWISDSNRKIISKFIAKKLNVGGVLYISYNSEPGRTAMRPFRELMQWHASKFSTNSSMPDKIDTSINFMKSLLDVNPLYKVAHPSVETYFSDVSSMDKNYLAHEFFNADWEPMSVKRLSDFLSACKLQFATTAYPIDLIPSISFTKNQLNLIQSIADPILREFVKDMCSNQGFRRDLWIKGGRRLSAGEKIREIKSISVTLVIPAEEITFELDTAIGKTTLNKEIYTAVIGCLNGKASIKLADIASELDNKFTFEQLLEVCTVLAGKKALKLSHEDIDAKKYIENTRKLNDFFISCSEFEQKVNYLVSPVSSTAIPVSRFEQLFIRAHANKIMEPIKMATFAWTKLKSQNEKIIVDGEVLETDKANLSHLESLAAKFIKSMLPELIRLKIL